MKKIIVNCPMHKEVTPSMIIDHDKDHYECLSCGAEGSIKQNREVDGLYLNHIANGGRVIRPYSFIDELFERCSDHYPIQIILNSGIIIECMTDEIEFYTDHFQIYAAGGGCKATVHYPALPDSEFSPRGIWVRYDAISLVADLVS